MNIGKLYIVAIPIGHPDDITVRAIKTLEEVDVIICEEFKPARRFLKTHGLQKKQLLQINEHNEKTESEAILLRMAQNGESMALISDCGTPVFSDPGHFLIQTAVEFGIPIVPIPGPSSLMATLSVLDFQPKQFVFGGFLSRDKNERVKEMTRLRDMRMPVILMDTPYRLTAVLQDAVKVFGKGRQATLACSLTQPGEKVHRGTLKQILSEVEGKKMEFMLVIQAFQKHQ